MFMGGIFALIRQNNKVTKVVLSEAQIPEEEIEKLKALKLKVPKIVEVTLPSGEAIQIKDLEERRGSKSKQLKRTQHK